jgi:hypothetical protein
MMHEKPAKQNFDTSPLLNATEPLPNNDPGLKTFVAQRGRLYKNVSVIGVRPAVDGEPIETWITDPAGNKVLERSTIARSGDLVAVGALGEQYIPSKSSIENNREAVGSEGLREDETPPPLPSDGHSYSLFRSNGRDFRVAAMNPYGNQNIYLRTSSGRLQTGVPGGMMAAQASIPPTETATGDLQDRLDVVRFIGPSEFAASYVEASPHEYAQLDVPLPDTEPEAYL